MSELITRKFEGNELRICKNQDGLWFYAKDVCDILGLKNTSLALRKLKEQHKGISSVNTLGGEQGVLIVSEAGLYKLIFQSRREEANKFQDWVFEEVLPSLRATGSYAVIQKTPAEQLLAQAQYMVDVERQAKMALKATAEVKKEQVLLTGRVDSVENVMNQMRRQYSGTEKLPDGLISHQNIARKYFVGLSDVVVSEYLKAAKHPTQPITYVNGDSHYVRDVFIEQGLGRAFEQFVRECRFVKMTDKNIQCRHDLVIEDFRFKKENTPYWVQEIVTNSRAKIMALESQPQEPQL